MKIQLRDLANRELHDTLNSWTPLFEFEVDDLSEVYIPSLGEVYGMEFGENFVDVMGKNLSERTYIVFEIFSENALINGKPVLKSLFINLVPDEIKYHHDQEKKKLFGRKNPKRRIGNKIV